MAEESVGPKTDTATKEKKSGGTADKKAEKKVVERPTPEGQKRVTDNYRANWKRIWGAKD